MTDTITRLVAHATTIGDPALLIFTQYVDDPGTDDEYIAVDDTPVAQRPLLVGESSGEFIENLDTVLAEMDYRRVSDQWEYTGDGAVALVETW
jgi:hypothetical protein